MEPTADVLAHRAAWHYRGQERPPFAQPPGPGEESVWDYPRPPRCEREARQVDIRAPGGELIASSERARRVVETAGPPTIYLPEEDVALAYLETGAPVSHCEWKGFASPVHWRSANVAKDIGWRYLDPYPEFAVIAGWYAFYPGRVDCRLGDEVVRPQPGGYYGGWVTDEIVGPFKGEPGIDGL